MIKSMLVAVDGSTQATEEYFSRLLIPYEVHYLRGDSHATILHHASEKGCDLLAMGAFTNRISEALALGTAIEAMLRQSQIPVLLRR
jgi:nucleotide-binding universal stress UspA family protein